MIELSSPFGALGLVLRVAAVAVAISSAELLSRPGDLAASGLLSGEIEMTRHNWLIRSRLRPLLGLVGSQQGAVVILAVRLIAALVLIVGAGSFEVARAGAIAVAVAVLLLKLRTPLGIHATGSMTMVVFWAAALGLLIGSSRSMTIALWFIASQGWLSYLVAGASKLRNPRWRRGEAILALLGTTMWGDERGAALLRTHPRAGLVACWMTILGESSVPLSLILPLPLTLAILACAAVFHVSTAFGMGLNVFVWAFPATYPAMLYCWYFVHGVH